MAVGGVVNDATGTVTDQSVAALWGHCNVGEELLADPMGTATVKAPLGLVTVAARSGTVTGTNGALGGGTTVALIFRPVGGTPLALGLPALAGESVGVDATDLSTSFLASGTFCGAATLAPCLFATELCLCHGLATLGFALARL